MPREKQKVEKTIKIVEVGAELVEDEALPAVCELQSTAQLSLTDESGVVLLQKTPVIALKSTIMKALPFVLISLAIFSIPFVAGPDIYWLKYAQVRTYILCALIWNLIGAVLYAQVDKRLSRLLIVLIFALPLITSHGWAPLIYTIEMSLRSVLSLPP